MSTWRAWAGSVQERAEADDAAMDARADDEVCATCGDPVRIPHDFVNREGPHYCCSICDPRKEED